ncbi:MAG: SDR family NAD(P)-dependent oxidoreductase [Candidatus Binatia bacterium]
MSFQSKYGPWALITGAAGGLGAEFARQVAGRGLDLILVDIDAASLAQTASAIRRETGRRVRTKVVDLAEPRFLDSIRALTRQLEVGLLINNAAISGVGLFLERPIEDHLQAVAVNVRAPLALTHALGGAMVARKRGGIILVSSMSALQGTAYVANYAATKAYDLILGEGLWEELRTHGVDVLAFLPGSTRTGGFSRSKPRLDRATAMPIMEVGPTAASALDALGKSPQQVAGRFNQAVTALTQRVLPRAYAIQLISRSMAELYARPPERATRKPARAAKRKTSA